MNPGAILLGLLCGLLQLRFAAASDFHGKEVRLLTKETFAGAVGSGAWLVKFYSPTCPHCVRFAPAYSKVAEEATGLQRSQFFLGAVDCRKDGDICRQNNVASYPTMFLFEDGVKGDQVHERDATELLKIVQGKSAEYAARKGITGEEIDQKELEGDDASDDAVRRPKARTVTALTPANFDSLIEKDMWFVKFFAPWCQHCKTLAPIWEKLAAADSNNCNFAEVDCTQHGELCSRHGVDGYPTLLVLKGSSTIKYQGSRSFEALESFCNRITGEPVVNIDEKPEITAELLSDASASFVAFLDPSSPKMAKRVLRGVAMESMMVARFFVTGSKEVAERLRISFDEGQELFPSLYVVSEGAVRRYGGAMEDAGGVRRFVAVNRFPRLVQLTPDNSMYLLSGDEHYLVLGLLKRDDDAARTDLRNAAVAVHQKTEMSTTLGRLDKVVIFAWLDAQEWSRYIGSVYGGGDAARIVVQDVGGEVFFDADDQGEAIRFEAAHIVKMLELIDTKAITGKSIHGAIGSFLNALSRAVNSLGTWIGENFYLTAIFFFFGVGFVMYSASRDSAEATKPSKAE